MDKKINESGFKRLIEKINHAEHEIAKYYDITNLEHQLKIDYQGINIVLLTIPSDKLLKQRNIDYNNMSNDEVWRAAKRAYQFYGEMIDIKHALLLEEEITISMLLCINASLRVMGWVKG